MLYKRNLGLGDADNPDKKRGTYLCVCVCVYQCVCVCIHFRISVCMFMYAFVCVFMCLYVCVYTCIFMSACVCMPLHVYINLCTCVHVSMYMYVWCVCLYIIAPPMTCKRSLAPPIPENVANPQMDDLNKNLEKRTLYRSILDIKP